MLLSDKRILEEREKGNIVIEPFDEVHLGTNSYDVRIGDYYYAGGRFITDVHLLSVDDVMLYWGLPVQATDEMPVDPGSTILAHTVERIAVTNGITFKMHSRSTIGRCGLSVCRCSGLGDVGYDGRLTMEVSNHTHARMWIPVNMRVAQITFEDVGETLKQYHGKYGQRGWQPEDMLPKPYLDFDLVVS